MAVRYDNANSWRVFGGSGDYSEEEWCLSCQNPFAGTSSQVERSWDGTRDRGIVEKVLDVGEIGAPPVEIEDKSGLDVGVLETPCE